DRREFRPRRDGARLRQPGAHAGRGEEACFRRPRALGRRSAHGLAALRGAVVGRILRPPCRPHRQAPRRAAARDRRRRRRHGRRVRHTMNPPLVLKDGKLWCVFGTPGADNQVQVNLQVLTAMIDLGLDPQQAAETPRWTSNTAGQYANYPHDGPDVLTIEQRFSDTARRDLAQRGHPVDAVGDLDGPCSIEIIRRDEAGTLYAGSDPRRDGWALAW